MDMGPKQILKRNIKKAFFKKLGKSQNKVGVAARAP